MATTNSGAQPILRTEALTHTVDDKTLVDDISIAVQPGELLAIIGPSGAGKSSFLRLLNRLDEPTHGTVYLDGQDYRTIPPTPYANVGMVMQAPSLFPGTVAGNLRYGPAQRGEHLSAAAVDQLLTHVGLADYSDREISRLSGGEAQRVSLARTLANNPEILLLDEPTSALDDATGRDVERWILRIHEERDLTTVLVTHDLEQARRLADRVMVLQAGALKTIGEKRAVLDAQPMV